MSSIADALAAAERFKAAMEKLVSSGGTGANVERLQAGIRAMAGRRCPCGHPLDSEGLPDEYTCLNGLIYGPCGEESCYGSCADTYGRCKGLDGCCDPREREDQDG